MTKHIHWTEMAMALHVHVVYLELTTIVFLHVISEFVVKGFNVALTTLQLLLKLSHVII